MNRQLIEDASWRGVRAGKWFFDLAHYGRRARSTAKRLRMTITAGVAYLTEASPDLADRYLETQCRPFPRCCQPTGRRPANRRRSSSGRRTVTTATDASTRGMKPGATVRGRPT
jgi:hypothetical protein